MENRFTIKDFILIVLLVALLISVWLSMRQYDRQWQVMSDIRARLSELSRDVIEVQRQLASGFVQPQVAPATAGATTPLTDPFVRIRQARALEGFAEGGMLVDAFGSSVPRLTPLVSSDAFAATIQGFVLESLADRDPDTLEWRPLIASGWRIIDQVKQREEAVAPLRQAGKSEEEIAADQTLPPAIVVVFTMRDQVRFSDGMPLTVDDVIFSYNWIMDPQVNAPRERAYFGRITSVKKTGDNEVTFTFTEPYFKAFELAASLPILPKHFYGAMDKEAFNQSVGSLLGSGPYRMPDPTTWRPGELIQLQRNYRYWGLGGAYDRFVWREISNDVARMQAFRNGELDIFVASPEQYESLIRDPAVLERAHRLEYQNPVGGYRYVAWNQIRGGRPTYFADPRVRRAMTMLLDREAMIRDVMMGYAVQATGPFNPLSRQSNPDIQPLPFDVDGAMALLREAGFVERNQDGVLLGPDGQPFRFRLTYVSPNVNYEKMALFMKDAFARAGIIMDLDPLDWSVLIDRIDKKDFDAITLGWTSGIETDIFQMFHSSQTIPGGDNFINYHSVYLDRVIDEARRTVDEQRRMELWREAHRIMHEDQPYTFLFFGKSLIFVDKRVHNVQQVKVGLNSRMEWFSPVAMQRVQ